MTLSKTIQPQETMKPQDARELDEPLASLVSSRQFNAANDLLSPVLAERTPFRLLDLIGERLGRETLGRYYPDLVAEWLVEKVNHPHRALMLRKATTYLPALLKERVMESR